MVSPIRSLTPTGEGAPNADPKWRQGRGVKYRGRAAGRNMFPHRCSVPKVDSPRTQCAQVSILSQIRAIPKWCGRGRQRVIRHNTGTAGETSRHECEHAETHRQQCRATGALARIIAAYSTGLLGARLFLRPLGHPPVAFILGEVLDPAHHRPTHPERVTDGGIAVPRDERGGRFTQHRPGGEGALEHLIHIRAVQASE